MNTYPSLATLCECPLAQRSSWALPGAESGSPHEGQVKWTRRAPSTGRTPLSSSNGGRVRSPWRGGGPASAARPRGQMARAKDMLGEECPSTGMSSYRTYRPYGRWPMLSPKA
eukprot:7054374-Prymnesium_polylepis.1